MFGGNMKGRIKAGEGVLIGNAGEYYVVAELLKRGIIAALAPRNAPSFDILATKGTCELVKTPKDPLILCSGYNLI
jgi:hypothetical protein